MKERTGSILIIVSLLAMATVVVFLRLADDNQVGELIKRGEPSSRSPSTISPAASASDDFDTSQPVSAAIAGIHDALSPATVELRLWLNRWAESSSTLPATERAQLLAAGLVIARNRAEKLAGIMTSDPRLALNQSLGWHEWRDLPPEIQRVSERPFSEFVEQEATISCGPNTGFVEHALHIVSPDGTLRRSYSHGRRERPLSRLGTPLQGFELGGEAALRESVVQVVTGAEAEAASDLFTLISTPNRVSAWSGEPLNLASSPISALVGGRLLLLSGEAELIALESRIHAWEDQPGPDGGVEELAAWLENEDPGSFVALEQALPAPTITTPWSETPKRLLMMSVDFPDNNGARETATTLMRKLEDDVSPAIEEMSFGKTRLIVTVVPEVIRMPESENYYPAEQDAGRNGNRQIHDSAKAGAVALGYDLDEYDFHCVQFKSIGMGYGGLAGIGGKNSWIQSSGTSVFVHEFGHNYGVGHSSRWLPAPSEGPMGPNGTNVEYGGGASMMGGGPFPNGHFDVQAKSFLNWLDPVQQIDVTASGRFRLFRSDQAEGPPPGVAGALRIDRGDGQDGNIWLGYKRALEGRRRISRGVRVLWEIDGKPRKNWTIQAGRTGSFDPDDFELPTGQTFSDGVGVDAIHITPVERGGPAPDEWIDVEVQLGTHPENRPPVASWVKVPDTSLGPFVTTRFVLQASDPDGDELAYHWDVGDGAEVSYNGPELVHTYTSTGSYTVDVEISDMRGGRTTLTTPVSIQNGGDSGEWTLRISGTSSQLRDVAAGDTRIVAVSASGAVVHSTDGATWSLIDLRSEKGLSGLDFREVLSDGTNFVAVGQQRAPSDSSWTGCIYHSPDGLIWTRVFLGGPKLLRVARGNGTWLASGDNMSVVRSQDGETWTTVNFPDSDHVQGIAYGNGIWLAMADRNNQRTWAFTSPDLVNWTEQSWAQAFGDNRIARPVRWLVGEFYFGGFALGLRSVSADGRNLNPAPELSGMNIYDMIEAQGQIFVTGDIKEDGTDIGHVHGLVPGGDWFRLDIPVTRKMRGVIAFQSRLIIVGDGGEIWQSGQVSTPVLDGWWSWQLENRDLLGPEDDPLAIPGGFGLPNVYHYALGNPARGGSNPREPIANFEGSVFSMQVPRDGIRSDVTYRILRSLDLKTWTTEGVTITRDASSFLEARGAGPESEHREFLQFRPELTP